MNPFVWEDGTIRVALGARERAFLPTLLILLSSVGRGAADPAAERLEPSAYPEDPQADQEYRRLMSGELEDARSTDRERFVATVDADRLSSADAEAWVRVLGDARLVLAARKGIVRAEDGWEERVADDPELGMLAYLGFLQGSVVDALAGSLETRS